MEFKLKAERGYKGLDASGEYIEKPPIFKEYYEATIPSDAGGFYGSSYSRSGHVDEDIIKSYPKEYKKFKKDLEERKDYHKMVALYEFEHGVPYQEPVEEVVEPVEEIEEVKAIEEVPQSPELKEVAPVVAETLEAEPEVTISDLEQEQIKEIVSDEIE